MRPIDPEFMRQLEHQARKLGDLINEALGNRPGQQKKVGFALMVFSFDGPEYTWLSNANRGDMVKALQEFIRRNPPDMTSEERN